MADSVTATAANPIVAKDGGFEVLNKDGKTTEKITFTALLVRIGIRSLDTGRESFATQFTLSQERVKQMEELNAISGMVADFNNNFGSNDAGGTTLSGWEGKTTALKDLIKNFNDKYPNNQLASEKPGNFTRAQIKTMESNIQSLSSTLASQSEQQSTRTTQAMNRSSNFLQQLQTMMQAAKESLATAARTGSAG